MASRLDVDQLNYGAVRAICPGDSVIDLSPTQGLLTDELDILNRSFGDATISHVPVIGEYYYFVISLRCQIVHSSKTFRDIVVPLQKATVRFI